ncbi:MAG: hypothetical protein AAFP98_11275 [Pseudomonadota bacterium]
MRQILLHPGFHRTGTSSIQHFLWLNRDALAPYLTVRLTRHFKPLAQKCNRYAHSQNPLDLTDLLSALDQGFAENPVSSDRDLIISCESFCGDIPGHHEISDYSAAPALITYIAAYLEERFPKAKVRVLMTTRAPDAWVSSTYRHVLRRSRLTQTEAEFATAFANAAQLEEVVSQIAKAIAPIETLYLPLELAQTADMGPGAAVLDQLNLPAEIWADLKPVGIGAQGPAPHIWGQFLAMNRSDRSDAEISQLKEQMAEAVKLGHWRTA